MRFEDVSIHGTDKGAVLSFMGQHPEAEAAFRIAFSRARWQAGYRQWFVWGTNAEWELVRWRDAYLARQGVPA